LGLHAIESRFTRFNEPTVSSDATRLGLNVLLGLELPAAARVQSSVEIAYHAVSHFGQFKLNWIIGLRL
jgi:hypothetical protein